MSRNSINGITDERQAYDELVDACLSIDSQQDEKKLLAQRVDFSEYSLDFHQKVEEFNQKVAKAPLSALILLWADLIQEDQIFGMRYLGMMRELIEATLLPVVSSKKKPILLQDFAALTPFHVIEKIRCFQDWSIRKREDHVLLYTSFSTWLSKATFGYVPLAKDPDRIATYRRQIAFEMYIDILSRLDLREQILAKIFYLGGQRNLEEVLSLKIEDVDFGRYSIHLAEDISYPQHLFQDLRNYIEDRKEGYVFMGRNGERISHTTPFRALKTVVSELNYDPEFTFKEFTKDI